MWHENRSVGQFRGENEIREIFPYSSYILPFLPILTFGFLLEYRQSTRNHIKVIVMINTMNYNEIKLHNI